MQFLSDFAQQLDLDAQNLKAATLTGVAAGRPSSDGLTQGGRLDLLRRAFVGLGLGQVTGEDDGQLVFNFNPQALRLASLGQFSPRVVVHKAALDTALGEHLDSLDDSLAAAARTGLEKDLGDLDDVEYTLRWTPRAMEPAADIKEVASTLFDEVVPIEPSEPTMKINQARAEIARELGIDDSFPDPPLVDICGKETAKKELTTLLADLETEIPRVNTELKKALDEKGFTRLADLIEGNPRLVFDADVRQRAGAAGADTRSFTVTWQRGWISYNGAKAFAREKKGLSRNEKVEIDATTLDQYFDRYGRLEGAAPLFSLIASYSQSSDFLVPIEGVADPFRQEGDRKLSIKATAARYFGGGRDRKLELTAAYDDARHDKAFQDRFVANLTWVETLDDTLAQVVGGSEFVASLVWADKPEFRGDVDQDFGLRAGLKWSFGDPKKN